MTIAERHVGTAGWALSSRYTDEFPGSGSVLERYASRLNSVEINSSFSKSHRRQTYEKWREAVGPDFRFSVKVPKAISHDAGLVDTGRLLERFANEVAGLREKLAVVLVQLPPTLVFDETIASRFFSEARSLVRADLVVEPRNASWFAPDTDAFLSEVSVALVAADPVLFGDGEPGGWDGLVYYRLHGAPRTYYSDYDDAALTKVSRALNRTTDVPSWCIFDNTAAGAALGNALRIAGPNLRRP